MVDSSRGIRTLGILMPAIALSMLFVGPVNGESVDSRLGTLEFEAGYPAATTVEKL